MVPAMLPPSLPIPDPLCANEAGTFAADSVVRRLPEIARRTMAENQLDSHRINRMETLIDEIGTGTVGPVDESAAADADAWRRYVDPHLGSTWLDAPWFFVETYFYRRVLAATGYSQPGRRRGIDPFAEQKALALESSLELAARLGETLNEPWALLGASLWSNQVDLSLWPAGEAAADTRTKAVLAAGRESQLVVNDGETVLEELGGARSVHLVLDNAGAELVADLALAATVLARGARVTLHAKPHPTFVSDTTLRDLNTTINRLRVTDSAAHHIAEILATALSRRALTFTAHPFWVSPLPFWQAPPDLVSQLRAADLIIVKGDANYRRLLGDRHWEKTTPFSSIVRPPAPLVALRTSKAEVMAGISQKAIDRARSVDPEWLVNGRWGLIQHARAAS